MKLNPDLFQGLEQLYRTLSKRHLYVIDACPAEMNGQKGFLGISSGIYTRVWFDTDTDSKTLFSSLKKEKALNKFMELKQTYGK